MPKTEVTPAMTPATAPLRKIDPNDVHVAAFTSHKSARVNLRHPLTFDVVRENPSLWMRVQNEQTKRLSRGDSVTLISADGLYIAENFIVTRALAGSLWFSKPLRIVHLEEDALFQDATYQVVPVGTGFSIQNKRDGRVDGIVYSTAKQAENEILSRQPKRA